MKRDEEKRVKLFYKRNRIQDTDCFSLYYPLRNGTLWPIGTYPGFRNLFNRFYGIGRPRNLEEKMIDKLIAKNPSLIKPGELYSAQLIIDGKPAEGFEIKNYLD
ncbi:MAG: hypothetical protein WC781_00920 [Candidatus Pacearchaeota archaeon]|jgi:hypothetical protein